MTFTSGGGQVTATAALGGDCGTDRLSHAAFYESAIALSLSLPLGRGTAFRCRLRHQRPFRFSGSI